MEGDDMIHHPLYCWHLKNVYLCEKLVTSRIKGPTFVTDKPSKCKWTLLLGQFAESEGDGIRLFIKPTGNFEAVLVNFRVSVREETNAEPFFYRKFQNKFCKDLVWQSPIVMSNKKFLKRFVTSEKLSLFWDIHVELMYNEEVDLKPTKSFPVMTTDLRDKRKVGSDLKKYLDGQFSDISIKIVAEEIKAHKAILHARSAYFAEKLSLYEKPHAKEDLSPTDDPEVMRYALMYLYTGDIYSLIDPLPLGIYNCAKRMKLNHLEKLTLPSESTCTSYVNCENFEFRFHYFEFEEKINLEKPSVNIQTILFQDKDSMFLFLIKLTDELPQHLSVFVKCVSGGRIFAHIEFSIRSKGNAVVFTKKVVGNLEKGCCLGFKKFLSIEELLKSEEYFDEGTMHFFCKGTFSKGDVDNRSMYSSINFCRSFDERGNPVDDCLTHEGYRTMASDLKKLLETSAFSDCIVVVGEKSFHVHKVILAARSSYFFEKLGGNKNQTLDCTSVGEIIIDKNIPAEHMNIIFEEIYTGSAEIQDELTANALYPLSQLFGLPSLEMKCLIHTKGIPANPYALIPELC